VQRGETLSGIAQQYGMSLSILRELNDIPRSSSLIRPGQKLVVSSAWEQPVHVVRQGETLSGIAHAYGVSLTTLRDLNDIPSNRSIIRPGQKLLLPARLELPETTRTHVVRRGDTLLEIAARYGVKLIDLLKANTLSINAVIHPGQTLSIP
jgi:LysM repeat protein